MKVKKTNKEDLNETDFAILRSFFPEGKDITLKKIVERSKYTYEPVHRTINKLLKLKLLFQKKFGRTFVYSLDFTKMPIKVTFFSYATKRANEFFNKQSSIYRGLSEIPEDKIEFLAVFGSYAKGTQTERSDVDVICVSNQKKIIEEKIKSLRYGYGKHFTPIVIPKTEFAKIKEENKEFWNDLLNYGIIIKGYETFYYYAYLR